MLLKEIDLVLSSWGRQYGDMGVDNVPTISQPSPKLALATQRQGFAIGELQRNHGAVGPERRYGDPAMQPVRWYTPRRPSPHGNRRRSMLDFSQTETDEPFVGPKPVIEGVEVIAQQSLLISKASS